MNYKVDVFDSFSKDKPRYFRSMEKAEAYADSIQDRFSFGKKDKLNIFILQRDNGPWYVVKHIEK